ncbi:MAG TPA: Lpg1974 family pore-forming outer membrane protein [Thermoguttaceae bacterium]|nr:Lpg1974 family pore-forming outer membrane protein [Thermoguttaceae bacterium]
MFSYRPASDLVSTVGYGDAGEDMGCDVGCSTGCEDPCGPRWRVYGDLLYLRPANEKVAFAVPINGPITQPDMIPVQIGLEAVVDCDYDPGFRVGAGRILNDCSEIGAAYTHFETDTYNQIGFDVPYVLRSLVNHPGGLSADTDFLTAEAGLDLDLDLVDFDYRRVIICDGCYNLNYLVGARYAHLDQTFASVFTNATTIETVGAAVRFDGGGIRLGLEGERQIGTFGLMVYGSGVASFVGGEFRGRYAQADSVRGLVCNTGWNEDRVVSILDIELGMGWSSPGGRLRATAGYMFSGWFNTVITDEFIDSVRANNSVDAGDSLSFDGLVLRGEVRF